MATVACYGPNAAFASKVVVGIIAREGAGALLKKWFSDEIDVRVDKSIEREMLSFIQDHTVSTVIAPDSIIGCPHEEGIDYADGEDCPECPFWNGRDRWTGDINPA